jgi:hypothetical protein
VSETQAAAHGRHLVGSRKCSPPRSHHPYYPYPPHRSGDDTSFHSIAGLSDEFNNTFHITVASEPERREGASSLLQRRYAWRGYSVAPLQADDAGDRVTLSAFQEDTTVATLTAAVDADEGLYVERLYPEAIDALRASGRKLCEFTRLAVDDSVRSHTVLGAIFHVACIYVIDLHECTDVMIEVNPRHVRFYERMLGFRRAADERMDPEVNAPAVLLRLDLSHCASEIDRLGGRRGDVKERSFYPFFFAREQAAEIIRRLRAH